MPTAKQSHLNQNESWEQREVQIKLEQAEQMAKMSPEQQAKFLLEERARFQEEQVKLKKELGYGEHYDPAKAKADPARQKEEQQQKEAELRFFEHREDPDRAKKMTPEQKESLQKQEFKKYFDAAAENIEQKKPFDFKSVALDNFGRQVIHQARMVKLTDHSQKNDLKPAEIWQRIEKKQAKRSQIGLKFDVDMGEDKKNSLGLTNVSMEISLESLMEGGLTEKLSRFTNMVYFAAQAHDRARQTELPASPATGTDKPKTAKPEKKTNPALEQNYKKYSINYSDKGEGQVNSAGALEQEGGSPVVFSLNNGEVWGSFRPETVPNNPKELQEALDKIANEK
jgi:hypothetical protein